MLRSTRALPVVLLAACSLGNEDQLVVNDAIYVGDYGAYGPDGQLTVVLTGYDRACDRLADWAEGAQDVDEAIDDVEDAAEAKEELWATIFPETFWTVTITARVDDPEGRLPGVEILGVDEGGAPDGDQQYVGEARFWSDLADEDYFRGDFDPEDYGFDLTTDGGDGILRRAARRGPLTGRVDTELVEADGDSWGDVALAFNATWCERYDLFLYGDGQEGGGGGGGGNGDGGNGDGGNGDGGDVDNVAACQDFADALTCGSTDFREYLPCASFDDLACDLSDYFDCLDDGFSCTDGVPDVAGWADCATLAACP